MKKACLGLLVLSLCLIAQDKTGGSYITTPSNMSASTYVSEFKMTDNSGKIVFKVSVRGEVTFGEGVKVSDAAKQFAVFLKQYMACPTTEKN